VRRILYMSALSAARRNPVLREVYQRLITKGKRPKVALTAVMRRLLVYMNHLLKLLATQSEPNQPGTPTDKKITENSCKN